MGNAEKVIKLSNISKAWRLSPFPKPKEELWKYSNTVRMRRTTVMVSISITSFVWIARSMSHTVGVMKTTGPFRMLGRSQVLATVVVSLRDALLQKQRSL
jgi:hypothetical protein